MATTNNTANVHFGKPKASGAIYRAALGTALPTDATTELSADYKPMGYVHSDGLQENEERTTENAKAWGGDTVAMSQTEYVKSFHFSLIERNENTLKARYGEDNVTVEGNSIHVQHTSAELEEGVWVIEIALSPKKVVRKVIPKGKPIEFDEISFTDEELIAYGITLGTLPVDGVYVHEYEGEIS